MSDALQSEIETVIAESTGDPATIASEQSLSGGCINDARRIELTDGRRFFLKSNKDPLPGLFEREAEGLAALAVSGAVRVPSLIGTGGGDGTCEPFIVLEMIEAGPRAADFSEAFGRGLAQLHRASTADRYGFDADNYIGATPQPNKWADEWIEFWQEHRLGYQVRLAHDNGYGSAMGPLAQKMADRLDHWIGEPDEPPTLCHGDLWSGNYLVDQAGHAVLIDPATYYGRREADLSMTTMFGGFDSYFYGAYREAWPLADGWEARLDIYQLYHHLNHLNLFGTGYLSGCETILRRYS
jgi:protein-ribulosamine 3-kinase